MFVSTFGPGMSQGVPDVCKTPPFAIPAPFPNLAANGMAVPTYFTICINAMPELNMTAMVAVTNGDEGGAMGGVASQVIMGPARCTLGSMAYFVAGQPIWRLTALTLHNLCNVPGTTMVPSQNVKQVLR